MEFAGGFLVASKVTSSQLVTWLAQASAAVKAVSSALLVSHAPQAPYFGPIGSAGSTFWTGTSGGYSGVYGAAPTAIDWFNVQFYNQGMRLTLRRVDLLSNVQAALATRLTRDSSPSLASTVHPFL